MRTREKSKKELLAIIKDLEAFNERECVERDEAIANRDWCLEMNSELAKEVHDLTILKLDLKVEVDRLRKEVKDLTDVSVNLRGEKEAEERFSQRISRELRRAEGERKRDYGFSYRGWLQWGADHPWCNG